MQWDQTNQYLIILSSSNIISLSIFFILPLCYCSLWSNIRELAQQWNCHGHSVQSFEWPQIHGQFPNLIRFALTSSWNKTRWRRVDRARAFATRRACWIVIWSQMAIMSLTRQKIKNLLKPKYYAFLSKKIY